MRSLIHIFVIVVYLTIISMQVAQAKKVIVVLKDKYQRTQFTITKNNGKTIVKNRKGFTVRDFIVDDKEDFSSYFRFNGKRVK